jgi:hypothetical protein
VDGTGILTVLRSRPPEFHNNASNRITEMNRAQLCVQFLQPDPITRRRTLAVVTIRLDLRPTRHGSMALPPIVEGLTAVWGSRSDVNQSGYLRIIASFGNHRTSPGVPDQQNPTFLLTKSTFYGFNVVSERAQGVLHRYGL